MKDMLRSVFAVAVVAALGWLFWEWGFCRFYVPVDHMAVITAKSGDSLKPGQILAKQGQKGVWEDVLGEGRYFMNPFLYEHKIVPTVTVPAGKVGIVTSKVGEDLPEGEFMANEGQKGIWRRVLGPGKYRINPFGYQIEVVDAISIPIGYVGVLTSLSGRQAPQGEFAGPGEKGVREDILQPGLYFANTKELKVDVLEIGVNQVSLLGRQGGEVLTKSVNLQPNNSGVFELQQNLLREQAQQRADYVNNSAMLAQQKADVASSLGSSLRGRTSNAPAKAGVRPQAPQSQGRQGAQQGEGNAMNTFVLNQFVEFPSKDGFEISLDMTVEFELLPERIAAIFRSYGDLPAVVEKAIMPQILSVSRMKGSAYGATDFIVGVGREKFQTELTEALGKVLDERKIKVHNALIRHVNVPDQILKPIQEAGIAVEQDLTNKEKQNTAKKEAELNTESSLIEQRGQEVTQETAKLCAQIRAEKERTVAQIGAETLKKYAEIESETARMKAVMTRTLGQAEADKVRMVEGEKARGYQLKAAAFGDAEAFTMFEFARSLGDDLRVNILHAGDGTLWTDLQRAGLGDLGGATILRERATPAPAAPRNTVTPMPALQPTPVPPVRPVTPAAPPRAQTPAQAGK